MKRLVFFLAVVMVVSCGRTFQQRTAKYAEVGAVSDNRAAVLEVKDGVGRWGYVDAAGRLVIECRYANAEVFSQARAAVQQGALWGYIDTLGVMVIDPQFSRAGQFTDGLAWVRGADGRTGRIDLTGRVVIPLIYTEIAEPDERGWMRVRRDGKWGVLLESGEVLIPCLYDVIGEPNLSGQIPVMSEGKWGLLSQTGITITPCAYDVIGEPNEYGLIPVTNDEKHGFLDAEGREALPARFTYISPFKGGFARTNNGGSRVLDDEPNGGLWGLVDSLGRETIPCRYYYLAAPEQGLAAFRPEQFGNYGYVDVQGNVAISPRYAEAHPFTSGVAVVSYNNVDFGIVDRNGEELSSFRYKRIGRFGDGLAPFNTNPFGAVFLGMAPRCGYLDTEGREALPARWDDAAGFSELRAAVMRFGTDPDNFHEARWGYIATSGQLVIPYKYHEAHPFSCGLARVFIRDRGYGYINRKGEEVVACQYEEAEDFQDFRARVKLDGRVMILDDSGQIVEGE